MAFERLAAYLTPMWNEGGGNDVVTAAVAKTTETFPYGAVVGGVMILAGLAVASAALNGRQADQRQAEQFQIVAAPAAHHKEVL